MAYLADVNVLIALLHARHAKSEQAIGWLDLQVDPASILVCRVAQMGVLRILTNATWMKEDCLSAAAIWGGLDLLFQDERFAQAEEPLGLEVEWKQLTRDFPLGRCVETDTYFAAFALTGGHRLVTFDRGFRRYEKLDLELLS